MHTAAHSAVFASAAVEAYSNTNFAGQSLNQKPMSNSVSSQAHCIAHIEILSAACPSSCKCLGNREHISESHQNLPIVNQHHTSIDFFFFFFDILTEAHITLETSSQTVNVWWFCWQDLLTVTLCSGPQQGVDFTPACISQEAEKHSKNAYKDTCSKIWFKWRIVCLWLCWGCNHELLITDYELFVDLCLKWSLEHFFSLNESLCPVSICNKDCSTQRLSYGRFLCTYLGHMTAF